MRLYGSTKKGTKIVKQALFEVNHEGQSFRNTLEECLIGLCRELDIPVPLWLKKNTNEFGAFHRTFFSKEQFVEKVDFDRFELKIEI